MGKPLEDIILKIKERINSGQFRSETAVREAIVLPILQALNWDIFDPASVLREFSLSGRRVDYALASRPPRVEIFIEVKAVGLATGADRQLFEYAFHEGIPFAILTDGREWNFFLPAEQGSYDDRRVQKLDIVERPSHEVKSIFDRYLDRMRVHSGDALESARLDYRSIARRSEAARKIPDAWRELVREPDEQLIELIAARTATLCGFRPGSEDVEAFLVGSTSTGLEVAPAAVPDMPRTSGANEPISFSERNVQYRLFGKARQARNATEALVDILRTLQSRDGTFLERLAPIVPGRTRNHVAREKSDVYPGRPELVDFTIELVPGWWLGTNISNRDKMRIIEKACQLERLTLQRDVVISLPNAG